MYLRDIVRTGKCEVNGRTENVGHRVRSGDLIEIEVDSERENAMRPEPIPLDILFEDEHLLGVDKPVGMLVHPTHRDKNGTLLNGLVHYLNSGGNMPFVGREVIRPGLVHRLDRETSGLMVIAKNTRVHRLLARQFQRRQVEKRYTALVEGTVDQGSGEINEAIGRDPAKKEWRAMPEGKPALTRFRVLERRRGATLLELEPMTGRTNQLRIHCAFLGHPIRGDLKRGGQPCERLLLHSWKLAFRHPVRNERIELVSKLPKEFRSEDT